MPSTAVYFEARPLSIALIAACLILSGVSKSGSPAPRPITFLPACLSARALSVAAMVGGALWVTPMVGEGLMRVRVSDRKAIGNLRFACDFGRDPRTGPGNRRQASKSD